MRATTLSLPPTLLLLFAVTLTSRVANADEHAPAAPARHVGTATTPATPTAAAHPPSDATPVSPSRPWAPPHAGRRFSLVATATYAAALGDVWGLKLEPYQFGVGMRAAYTLPIGVWFGLYGEVFQGSTVQQTYHPPFTLIRQDVNAESRAAVFGASVGYDQQVGPVVLRYLAGLGATILAWDFGAIPYDTFAGFSPMNGSLVGMHFDMGAGVVLPLGPLELGLEAFYRMETSGQIPGGAGGRLVLGGRL